MTSELFWDFSIRTYRTDDVPEACLSLQDERDVDVNMLLFCCWYGATRGVLDDGSFRELFDFSENWAVNVVRPLRRARTWMKKEGCVDPRVPTEACMEYREKVKGVEFTAEKIQQEVLESMVERVSGDERDNDARLRAIVDNVRRYFIHENIVDDDFSREKLLTIIRAGVTSLPEDEIRRNLQETAW